ncbi:MAG: DnaJ domain-containing protein [Paludibacteraceae bacterium]|nr:DnaJ domain-containing protein [Paludibacteraceae bacterium]
MGHTNNGSQNHTNNGSQDKRENEIKFSEDEKRAYGILGVDPNDSDEVIKKAYQKLKKIYSVDNNKKYKNNKKQYGPDKNDNSQNFVALNQILWAWNVIKKARKNRQSTNRQSTDGNIKEADYKYCLLSLYAKVMKADGKQMVCELDKIKETIYRYNKTEDQQIEALKELRAILDSNQNWEEVYDTVNRRLNYVAKSELVMELLALAYSDDDFSAVEESVIKEIARNLNFSNEKYKSIYTIFLKKHEDQKYKANNKDKRSDNNHNNNKSEKQSKSNNSSNSQAKNKNRISVSEAYAILGVSGDISDAEIKKAYRALAIQYHPDNSASLGDEAIRQATETMKQINVAWGVVKMARGMK